MPSEYSEGFGYDFESDSYECLLCGEHMGEEECHLFPEGYLCDECYEFAGGYIRDSMGFGDGDNDV